MGKALTTSLDADPHPADGGEPLKVAEQEGDPCKQAFKVRLQSSPLSEAYSKPCVYFKSHLRQKVVLHLPRVM